MQSLVQIENASNERYCFAASCVGKKQYCFCQIAVTGGSFL